MLSVSNKAKNLINLCAHSRKFSKYCQKYNNMNIAYFRHQENEPQFQITFHYTNPTYGVNRIFNFSRSLTETVNACLDRIKTNVEKEFQKKNKKKRIKKEEPEATTLVSTIPEIIVQLKHNEDIIIDKNFEEIFTNAPLSNMSLIILDQNFDVAFNLPWVQLITLPTSILAGFYVYPAKLEILFGDKDHSKFTWFHGLLPKSGKDEDIEWTNVGTEFFYKVQLTDIGYKLKVQCLPNNGNKEGPPSEIISKCLVQAGPGDCPFEMRQAFTSERLIGKEFRIMSYNILADLYADSDYSHQELFPYCPKYALSIDYRKQLFIKEILDYNSDIICLQEVDSKIYDLDLLPLFNTLHYNGYYKKKGETAEGLATFYYNNRFELIQEYGINIGESIKTLPIYKELYEKIRTNEHLLTRIVERSTAIQATVLQSKDNSNQIIIVANTHLYFHPDADHIRLLQFGLSMLYIEDLYKKIKNTNGDKNISVLFCGDFNSVPECGIYKLMTENFVGDDFIDWKSNEEQAVTNVTLSQKFNMKSACGCPTYTNYTVGFKACLDYIFYQTDHLNVFQVIPFPSEEELQAHIAIPSVVCPSDHIALVADLEFK